MQSKLRDASGSLDTKNHISLHWAPCCGWTPPSHQTYSCISVLQSSHFCDCNAGISQGWHSPLGNGEVVHLQTVWPGTTRHQLTAVKWDRITCMLLLTHPDVQCWANIVSGTQPCMKDDKGRRLKYFICLRGKDLLTQDRNYDEILFARQVHS